MFKFLYLVGGTDLEWSTIFALEFSTEELTISGRFEVVVVSKSSVVGEGNASALFRIVVVSSIFTFENVNLKYESTCLKWNRS